MCCFFTLSFEDQSPFLAGDTPEAFYSRLRVETRARLLPRRVKLAGRREA